MAYVLLNSRRSLSPNLSAQLAPEYADARFIFAPGLFGRDVVTLAEPTLTGSGFYGFESDSIDGTLHVYSNTTSSGNNNGLIWADDPRWDVPSAYTMFMLVKVLANSSAAYDRIFHRDAAAYSLENSFGFLYAPPSDPTAPNRVYFANFNGPTQELVGYTTAQAVYDGTRFEFYLASHTGSTLSLYRNGVLVNSTGSTPSAATAKTLRIGGESFGFGAGGAFSIALAGLLPRAASQAEAYGLWQSPWKVFSPIQRRIYVGPSVGSGIAGAGAVTLADLALSGTGNLAIAGSLSTTLGAATLAGMGRVDIAGALGVALGDLVLSATGTVVDSGIPVLSAATAVSITATSATPRVTLTF